MNIFSHFNNKLGTFFNESKITYNLSTYSPDMNSLELPFEDSRGGGLL